MKMRNDMLTELLEKGVGPITIGKPPGGSAGPGQAPNFYVSGNHMIPVPPLRPGNQMQAQHQSVGDTIDEALTAFYDHAMKVEDMKAKPVAVVPHQSKN
jgi:hypothetical protein